MAVNEIGDSDFSAKVSYIAAQAPDTPRSIAKVSADASQITLSWLEPLETNGSPVTTYQVYQDGVTITPSETGTDGAL